jgi:hypothetical protein
MLPEQQVKRIILDGFVADDVDDAPEHLAFIVPLVLEQDAKTEGGIDVGSVVNSGLKWDMHKLWAVVRPAKTTPAGCVEAKEGDTIVLRDGGITKVDAGDKDGMCAVDVRYILFKVREQRIVA